MPPHLALSLQVLQDLRESGRRRVPLHRLRAGLRRAVLRAV